MSGAEIWYGYRMERSRLQGREVILVRPNGEANGKWLLKTEYFGAFPAFETEMLARGWHVAHIENKTRWNLPEDTDAKAMLARHLHEMYGLEEKCVPVGMSCGGLQGIHFAAKYPQHVHCLYLDAPVVNLLSCPAGLGKGSNAEAMEEMLSALHLTPVTLLSYREHPLDRIPALVEHRIPVVLVSGDSDRTVPYEENGALLAQAYAGTDIPFALHLKPGGDHHPHGLEDNAPIIGFVEKHSI